MNLTTLLKEESILLTLEVQSKEDCIGQIAESLDRAGFLTDHASYLEAVLHREKLGSTGVGFGVAIPHGKSSGVAKPGLAFAKLKHPIDWQSLDDKPVSMVFLIAVPEEKAGNEHLQILASISRKLMHEEFRDKLLTAQSPQEVMDIFETV
jgi:PTS system fructose-specific IIA component